VRRQTPVLQIVGLLFWLLATQGCTGPDLEKVARKQSTQSPKEASEGLRFAISEDPRSLEPGLSLLLQDSVIALNLHVGLFKYDRDSVLQPYLVREWSLSSDRLTYTFVLHDDWRWHNGRLISAADIKRDWERYLNPKLAAWGANYLSTIAGSPEMLRGTASGLQGVEVVNANTLKVTLMRPDPLFLLRLGPHLHGPHRLKHSLKANQSGKTTRRAPVLSSLFNGSSTLGLFSSRTLGSGD